MVHARDAFRDIAQQARVPMVAQSPATSRPQRPPWRTPKKGGEAPALDEIAAAEQAAAAAKNTTSGYSLSAGVLPVSRHRRSACNGIHRGGLRRRWPGTGQALEGGKLTFGSEGLPGPRSPYYDALQEELAALADAVDAVSDALMAESVYQVVRGNPLRAASTVDSLAGGETPPPELEVVRTPRTGIALRTGW